MPGAGGDFDIVLAASLVFAGNDGLLEPFTFPAVPAGLFFAPSVERGEGGIEILRLTVRGDPAASLPAPGTLILVLPGALFPVRRGRGPTAHGRDPA